MLEEPQLNGRIASVINRLTASSGWMAREELRGSLRGSMDKPDILITRKDGPPVAIEVEYRPFTGLHGDCMKRVGRRLNASVANATGQVNTVIAVRADEVLHGCLTGAEAEEMIEGGHAIEYAAYQGTSVESTKRFPSAGFITGNLRDLVDFIQPAAQPQDLIAAATNAFEEGVEDAAALLLACARDTDIGDSIGTKLRQPWPAYPVDTLVRKVDIEQERADQTAREQTAKMTVTMMINALAFQQNLAGYSATVDVDGRQEKRTVKSLRQVRGVTGYHPDAVIAEWDNIMSINYWPIFHVAKQLLLTVPPTTATQLLDRMVETANAIQDAINENDVAGTLFQRLISDRQTLATYYTRPESTTLIAYLAVPDDLDWSDPKTFRNYRIADYACGTGGLVLAAYQRIRELHRNHGGDPDRLHAHMMENNLTASDIMPAAVHLTSSLLSSVAPRVKYTGTRNILYPYGASPVLDSQGNWIVEHDKNGKPKEYQNGRPVYRMNAQLGSLELLNLRSNIYQAVLPLTENWALAGTEESSPVEVEMTPWIQDLVIMNPPFTTPTNHAADHAKPGNPVFAAFGTTVYEQDAMNAKTKRIRRNTIGDGYAGLGTYFTAIAHNMVKPDGRVALILPMSSMIGGSQDGNRPVSWQKLRHLLADHYNDIIIMSIAQPADVDAAFSADTGMGEVTVIARRIRRGEFPRRMVHFVNLAHRPADKLSAMETAKAVRRTIATLNEIGTSLPVKIGDVSVGSVQLERVDSRTKWTTCRIVNLDLSRVAQRIGRGVLMLPQHHGNIDIPICPMSEVGTVGPVHRSFENTFNREKGADPGTEWPMLWNRDSDEQYSMAAAPDHAGDIKAGKVSEAQRLWKRASNLHISAECRFNSNATCAVVTERITAGGRAWPNFRMQSLDFEKATCAWLNSTLGMITYWIGSNRTQSGRGGVTVTSIPTMPTLDVRRLGPSQLSAAIAAYDDLKHAKMLPANEAYRDAQRSELDRRILTEVLGLDADSVSQLEVLRYQWCSEPTVSGTKGTRPNSTRPCSGGKQSERSDGTNAPPVP